MTSARRHSRAPLRRSSAPERILSAGLATATCVGIVGLIGARTIEANAESTGSQDTTSEIGTAEPVALVEVQASTPVAEPTTSTGLTEADLDAYALQLAAEKDRLDAYRAKLVKTAKKLNRQANRLAAKQAARVTTTAGAVSTPGRASSGGTSSSTPAKPAAKAPQKPAPKPAAAPAAKAAPQQQAPAPQSNTKSS